MKLSKKKNSSASSFNQFIRYVPINEDEFPNRFENMYRFYVREKFIVYTERYPKTGDIKGFLLIWSEGSKVIENLPFDTMWFRVNQWCDENEGNQFFKSIAKIYK